MRRTSIAIVERESRTRPVSRLERASIVRESERAFDTVGARVLREKRERLEERERRGEIALCLREHDGA